MENTQVRFANISIKASDEFMQAVNEQKEFTKGEFLIYKKKKNNNLYHAPQDFRKTHYSINIPAKKIQDYDLIESFKQIKFLKVFLRCLDFHPGRCSIVWVHF